MSLKGKLRTGGFLNNVDVTVTDANWVVSEETYKIKQGKNKGKAFTPLSLIVDLTVDGAEEATPQRLFVGGAENMTFEISEDGKTIQFSEGGIFGNSEAGIFLNSCEEPENGDLSISDFGDDDVKDMIDVTALVGARMRVVRPINKEKDPQKGKDGKMYPVRNLMCAEVYEIGGAVQKAVNKVRHALTGKSPTTGTSGSKPRRAVAAPEEDAAEDVSPEDTAKIALLRYLEGTKDRTLPITKLKTKVSVDKEFAKDATLRRQVIALLEDADFLKGIDEVQYNGKKGTVTLPED